MKVRMGNTLEALQWSLRSDKDGPARTEMEVMQYRYVYMQPRFADIGTA